VIETESSTVTEKGEDNPLPMDSCFSTRLFGPVLHPEYKNPLQDITPEEYVQIIYRIQVVAVVFWPLQGFFNLLIFARLRFVLLRHLCQDASLFGGSSNKPSLEPLRQ
jgi:hypothetical protein